MLLKLKSFSLLNDYRIDSKKSDNKKRKIRERLKELSQLMANWRLISIEWNKKWNAIVIVLNNGIISSIYLNDSNHIINVYNDTYLTNKLLSEHIVNVVLRDNYILISYTQSKLTLVSISQTIPKTNKSVFKLSNRNANISAIDLENGTTRRVERNLMVNTSGDLLLVWWKTGTNCVAPWSAPGRNTRDLANIFVYTFTKSNFELMSLGCSSGHIFQIVLSEWNANQLVSVQQSTDSAYVLNYCVLEMVESMSSLALVCSIRMPLLRRCVRAELTRALDKVVVVLDDDSISVFNIEQNALYSLHSSVNAFDFSCHPFDAIFTVADQFGRLSIYDYAFNTIPINYEELITDRIVRLNRIKFIDSTRLCLYFNKEKLTDITVITLPVVIDNKTLVSQYLTSGKCDEAIACLQCINWNCYSDSAYTALNYIFNHLIKQPFNPIRELQLETTLATFLTPSVPIDEEISKEYKLEIHFLAKRFFYHLLRYNCLDKAFLLGLDLKSEQLFALLHRIAAQRANDRISNASLLKSQQYSQQEFVQSLQPLQSTITFTSCEQNNNNNNNSSGAENKSAPVETNPNIIGLPMPESVEYIKYQNCMKKVEPKLEANNPLPIASILKPTSSKSKATVIATKPVAFRNINPSDTYNKDIIFFEPTLKEPTIDSLYAISTKHKKTTIDRKSIKTNANSLLSQESVINSNLNENCNNFLRAYSSCSSSRCSSSSTSSSSPCSSTSASLSLPTPSDSSLPPELPPKTYLTKSCTKSAERAPERPPKKRVISSEKHLKNEELDEKYGSTVEDNDNSLEINLSHMKSGSKIECIHFGVV